MLELRVLEVEPSLWKPTSQARALTLETELVDSDARIWTGG